MSSGSVIGVDWRYSTSGLSSITADATIAATADPVVASTMRARTNTVAAKARTDRPTAKAPVR